MIWELKFNWILYVRKKHQPQSCNLFPLSGKWQYHIADGKIQTQLKGLLILHFETEQGKVTQKVIVE